MQARYLILAPWLAMALYGLTRAPLQWTVWAGLCAGVAGFVSLGYYDRRKKRNIDVKLNAIAAVIGAVTFAGAGPGLATVIAVLSNLLQSAGNSRLLIAAGCGGVLLLSASLFYLRLRCRFIYGFTEVVVAIFVSVYKFNSVKDLSDVYRIDFAFAVLTASVYLIVRGLDNMHQGVTKEPKDEVLLWLSKQGGKRSLVSVLK